MLLKLFLKSLVFVFLFTSCSSLSSKEKIYSGTALGFSSGFFLWNEP